MKQFLISIALVIVVNVAFAQDFPYHYFNHTVPLVANPSLAAAKDQLSIDLASYNLWAAGFKPLNDNLIGVSYQVNRAKRAKKYSDSGIGVGFTFANENYGPFSKNILQLMYAYHIPLTRELQLSLGISGMLENMNINVGSLSPQHEDDPRLVVDNNKSTMFDGGFGATLSSKYYVVALSVLNLAPSNYSFEETSFSEIRNFRKYFLSGSYNIELNQKMSISPSVVLRNIEQNKFSFDAFCDFRFSSFHFGIGYRNEKTLFVFTKIQLEEFEFAYTSENPMEANHMIGNGHTFSIGWRLRKL